MTETGINNEALNGIIDSIAEISGYIWQKGWAEKNAGNISVNLKDVLNISPADFSRYPYRNLPSVYEALAGVCFLVTGTGKKMRDIARDPMKNALIIMIDDKGKGYHIISPSAGEAQQSLRPTSELASHLSIQSMIAVRGSGQKSVIHAHVNELCALTQLPQFCNEEKLNRLLWGMHPETRIFVPGGVGFVPYCLPGSAELAVATVRALANHDVALWEKHGVFAIGDTVDDTFDTIDILAKSASIFFTCHSSGYEPAGLTDKQTDELGKLIF